MKYNQQDPLFQLSTLGSIAMLAFVLVGMYIIAATALDPDDQPQSRFERF